jgi:folate-binding protein YgfZ
VGVSGPDAEPYLQRMLSNDVEALGPGESCEALLLTPKGRVIAPMTVWRRSADDYLLLTEPELAGRLRDELVRSRLAAKVEIAVEEHVSALVLGREAPPGSVANRDYGVAAYEVLDDEPPNWTPVDDEELERLRIRARTPRFGRELDDRVLPAEAGLEERAISFTKGCYPGQEPVARLHYRGHANRSLRVLALTGEEAPAADAELVHEGKVVGRVTSAVSDPEEGVVALAYVRAEVPPDAILEAAGREARQLDEAAP